MKKVTGFLAFLSILSAQEIVLKPAGEYKILSNVHLVNGVSYKKPDYQALIEIPAGTTAKWEVNHETGHLEWEFKNKKPRNVKFLGYPGNYGFIPQTILEKNEGGDGDPLDIIVLGSAVDRGSIQAVKVLGALKLLDSGEQDDKIIAVPMNGPFSKVESLGELMTEFPGTVEIIRYWFTGYKGGEMHFMGYMKRKEAEVLIEKAHESWSKQHHAH
ncbi:MAG: inorganic diphosphatase [Sulfurovum sp.]|nr:inorganic diphosphatase [Sulfurovum sp.]